MLLAPFSFLISFLALQYSTQETSMLPHLSVVIAAWNMNAITQPSMVSYCYHAWYRTPLSLLIIISRVLSHNLEFHHMVYRPRVLSRNLECHQYAITRVITQPLGFRIIGSRLSSQHLALFICVSLTNAITQH